MRREGSLGAVEGGDLRADEWAYLGEGRMHVVCRYIGSHARYKHHVLRVVKVSHEGEGEDNSHHRERAYLDAVVRPVLGLEYLHRGFTLHTPPDFIAELAERIEPSRPVGRRQYGLDTSQELSECHHDHTSFFPLYPADTDTTSALVLDPQSPCVTVELKPKGGLAPRSYLVDPAHRHKYKCSRFELMQRYKWAKQQQQHSEPEWGHLDRLNLKYSPYDLYSHEGSRVIRALRAIAENPQNFLQIFLDSVQVFGRGESGREGGELAIRRLLFGAGVESELGAKSESEGGAAEKHEDPFDALVQVLASILLHETILDRLLALQALDVLDVEGAGLVMGRLTELCGGDQDEALRLIDQAEARPVEVCPSAVAASSDISGISAISAISARLTGWRESMADDEVEEQRRQALACVAGLTKEECVELLHRWLVALGACDCSLMISLRRVASGGEGRPRQTARTPGVVTCGRSGVTVAYYVQAVDVGPKPATKIRAKALLEAEIVRLAASSVNGTNGV